MKLTADDRRQLGELTTRDDGGRHFTEVYGTGWLEEMASLGLIRIDKPVHTATGIPYSAEYWAVLVSPAVADWFDTDGYLLDDTAWEVSPGDFPPMEE
jgi:hypothetical protein